jgi:hypothetical protein
MLRGHTSTSLINSVVFLSPTLSQIHLHIDVEVSDQAIQTFFKTMEFYGQNNLRNFSFSHGRNGPFVSPITNALLSLLQSAQNLTKVTLTLSAVTTAVFTQLATMPHLVTLRVNASRHSIAEAEVVTVEQNNRAFPSLRELYLSNKAETCANIIRAVVSPLETIRLQISCYSVETLEAISKHANTLRHLVVEVLDREKQPYGREIWFHPDQLLSCHALRVLSIISPNVLHITPTLLETMAKAWQSIQYLSLNPRPSAPPEPPPAVFHFNPFVTGTTDGVGHVPSFPANGVTLVSLEPLMRETAIRHLGIIFDACAPPEQGYTFKRDTADSSLPPGFTLRTLDPGYSPLPEDIGPVSVAISNLFPNAILGHDEDLSGKRIYFSRYFNKLADRWKQVNWVVKRMKEKQDQSKKVQEDLMNQITVLRAELRKHVESPLLNPIHS